MLKMKRTMTLRRGIDMLPNYDDMRIMEFIALVIKTVFVLLAAWFFVAIFSLITNV